MVFFLLVYAPLFLSLMTVYFLFIQIWVGKSIKNPNYAPVYGTIFNHFFYLNKLYDYQTEIAKNQPTFRLLEPSRSDIFTTDIRNVEHVLKTNFDKYCKGEFNHDILKDLMGQGIFAVDGDKWRQQRKLASFEFSTRILRDFSCSVFRSNAAKLVRALHMEYSKVSGQVFDIKDMIMRNGLDTIGEVGFGVELHCLEGTSNEGAEFMKAFDEANEIIYWRIGDPFWKLKRFLNIGSEAVLKKNIKIIDNFIYNLISTKRQLLAKQANDIVVKEDILSRFLVESKKNSMMNDQYIRDVILSFLIAGKDSSVNALSWFFYMLCKYPLIQEKIVQEVRQVTGIREGNDTNVDDFMATITDATLDQMHYLHAALTETLRLYPAVPLDGYRAKVDDILPDGYRVKKGDGVYYMAYAMGRMTYIWGDDACHFRPERWLKDGVFQPRSPFKFVSFHAGPRTCLGKEFAYRQMKIITMALLHCFRFKLANDGKNLTYRTTFTLQIKGGLHLYVVPRTKSNA